MLGVQVFPSRWKMAFVCEGGKLGKPEIVAIALPVLVTVTVIGALIEPAGVGVGNTSGFGEKIRTGPLPPVPFKDTLKTTPWQGESHIRSIPKFSVTGVVVVGLKVTPTTHEAPAARLWPGSSVIGLQAGMPLGGGTAVSGVKLIVKCEGRKKSEKIAGKQPVQLVIFTSCSALVVVVTGVVGNTSGFGEKVRLGRPAAGTTAAAPARFTV